MSKKSYRTRRKHRSNKRSIKRTNRKINKRTKKRINNRRKTNKRTNKHSHKNENQNGGAEAFRSLFRKVRKSINEVELIWDDLNSSEIGFNNETGVLQYKGFGIIREFTLDRRSFSINNLYDLSVIGFSITFANEPEKKITIKFTGENAEKNKLEFESHLRAYNIRPPSSGNTRGMDTRVSPQPLSSASAANAASGSPSLAGSSGSILAAGPLVAGPLATEPPATTSSPLSAAREEVIARPQTPPQTPSLLPRVNDDSRSSLTPVPKLKSESNVKWKMYTEGENESNAVDLDDEDQDKIEAAWQNDNYNRMFILDDNRTVNLDLMELKYNIKYKLIRVDTNPKPSPQLTLRPGSGTPPSLILQPVTQDQQDQQNSPHPLNRTLGTPPIRTSSPQSVKLEGIPIVRFGNSGNHCYRNAVYSVFLNNAFIRREIMELKEATVGKDFNLIPYNNFITCLKNIARGETTSLHPGGPSKGGNDPLQINTAMYNCIASYVKSTESNEWVRFLDSEDGFSNEDQQDSGEFLGYFSRAFSLIGIKVCKYEQITATMKNKINPPKYWNAGVGNWTALSTSTYQLTTFDDTLKQNELDLDEGKSKSIFTDYREIFIKDKETLSVGDYAMSDDVTIWNTPVRNIRGPFNTTPNFVCLNNNRYKHTTIWGVFQGYKNIENLRIEEVISVPMFLINDNKLYYSHHDYNCCGVIFHLGDRPNHGHYVSCVKINNVWYYFNDGHETQILDEDKVKELFADTFQPPVESVSPGDRFTIVTIIYELDGISEP